MNEEEVKALIALLDDEDDDVAEAVAKRIQSIGPEIVPFLEKAWEHESDSFVQSRIENLIHNLQFIGVEQRLLKWKYEGGKDLLKGVHILATYQYPELNYLSLKQQIDQLSIEAAKFVKDDVHPYDQIRLLNHFFFVKNKFTANKKEFYSAKNSFLNVVLESRKGIPLTLSIIYQLIAQRLGMPVYGVNLPNLFVLTYKGVEADKQFYINVYNSGLIFTTDDIKSYIEQLKLPHSDIFFQPTNNIEIVKRGLRNLITSYEHSNDMLRKSEIEQLLIAMSDGDREQE